MHLATIQKLIDPLFPGLMGVRLTEATPERVFAELPVRPVTQTQLVLEPSS